MKKISILLVLIMTFVFSLSAVVSAESVKSNVNYNDEIYEGVVSYVNEIYADMDDEEKEKLIEELYKEKSEFTLVTETFTSGNNEIDEAYKRVMDEENYIVNLIIEQGKDTALDKWEFNLNYLKNNYETIKNIPDINLSYVDSYIEAYEWQLISKDMPDEKINRKSVVTQSNEYDWSKAVEYAKKYYKDYNDAYPDWSAPPYGGDWANFISQCVHEGGKPMEGTPGTEKEAKDWSNWFSEGKEHDVKKVSSTWRGANAFKSYWQSHATAYKKFTSVGSESFSFGWNGDAVALLTDNDRAYHVMIIVGYTSPLDFVLAAHTYDTKSAKLSEKIPSHGCMIFNMRE